MSLREFSNNGVNIRVVFTSKKIILSNRNFRYFAYNRILREKRNSLMATLINRVSTVMLFILLKYGSRFIATENKYFFVY